MRGTVETLEVGHSLAEGLPGEFLSNDEDLFLRELVAVLDQVLAPVFVTLDNLDAYLDPLLAPEDFLPWLAGWLGLVVDERWPPDRVRRWLAQAHEVYAWRGTPRGIAAAVHAYAGVAPQMEENGAIASSARPGGALPGESTPRLVVRVVTSDPTIDAATLDRVVAEAKPAHVPHRVEVLQG